MQTEQQNGQLKRTMKTRHLIMLSLVACVGLWFDPSQRIALYCGLPFVALCYGAYYLTRNLTTQEPEHVAE
ncbi:hypothetical protein ENINCK417B_10290 [Enterobacter intestinihominis]